MKYSDCRGRISFSPSKASKITGEGPISAGPSGYFARGIPVPGSVEGFVRNSFPTSVRAILLLLIYKASAYSNWYTAIRLYSVSRTWSALNIVKQPCVESLELLNEMEESRIKCLSEASFDDARNEFRSSGFGAPAVE